MFPNRLSVLRKANLIMGNTNQPDTEKLKQARNIALNKIIKTSDNYDDLNPKPIDVFLNNSQDGDDYDNRKAALRIVININKDALNKDGTPTYFVRDSEAQMATEITKYGGKSKNAVTRYIRELGNLEELTSNLQLMAAHLNILGDGNVKSSLNPFDSDVTPTMQRLNKMLDSETYLSRKLFNKTKQHSQQTMNSELFHTSIKEGVVAPLIEFKNDQPHPPFSPPPINQDLNYSISTLTVIPSAPSIDDGNLPPPMNPEYTNTASSPEKENVNPPLTNYNKAFINSNSATVATVQDLSLSDEEKKSYTEYIKGKTVICCLNKVDIGTETNFNKVREIRFKFAEAIIYKQIHEVGDGKLWLIRESFIYGRVTATFYNPNMKDKDDNPLKDDMDKMDHLRVAYIINESTKEGQWVYAGAENYTPPKGWSQEYVGQDSIEMDFNHTKEIATLVNKHKFKGVGQLRCDNIFAPELGSFLASTQYRTQQPEILPDAL